MKLLSLWLQRLISVFRSSQQDGLSTDVVLTKLESLEATQLLLLKKVEDLSISNVDIPKNKDGLYKVGPGRIIHYLNELVPQVYLTLVSVLQGVALAILLNEFRSHYLSSSFVGYFYFASSFLVIVSFWYAFEIVVLIRSWPLHFIDVFIYFAAATAQCIGYQNVSTPSYWFMSIAGMCFVFVFAYSRQLTIISRSIEAELYDEQPHHIRKHQRTIRIFVVLFLFTTALSLVLAFFTLSDPENVIAASIALAVPIVYITMAIREAKDYGIHQLG